jgi:hypothetical protein
VCQAREVVATVETAQRHAALLLEQSNALQAQKAAAEEAAHALRSQLATAQGELEAVRSIPEPGRSG